MYDDSSFQLFLSSLSYHLFLTNQHQYWNEGFHFIIFPMPQQDSMDWIVSHLTVSSPLLFMFILVLFQPILFVHILPQARILYFTLSIANSLVAIYLPSIENMQYPFGSWHKPVWINTLTITFSAVGSWCRPGYTKTSFAFSLVHMNVVDEIVSLKCIWKYEENNMTFYWLILVVNSDRVRTRPPRNTFFS